MPDKPMNAETLKDLLANATPGPWESRALGGASTVTAKVLPRRNDLRARGSIDYKCDDFCIGYPWVEDEAVRFNIVWFSHADARLIALAPKLAAENIALQEEVERLRQIVDDQAKAENVKLRGAVEALGAMPGGYCFCSRNRIGDDSKVHEPECADLRDAFNDALQASKRGVFNETQESE